MSTSSSICQLHHNTPLPIILKFFEAGEGYDKYHRCGINNSNSSNITGEKNSGGSIMPYESLDSSPDTQVSSKPDRQTQLLLKTVSSIQALGVCSALCSTNET